MNLAAGPRAACRAIQVVGLDGSSAGARPLPITGTNRVYSTGVQGTMSGTWKRLQDWLIVVIGALLFVAPFVLGATANQAAARTAYATDVLPACGV